MTRTISERKPLWVDLMSGAKHYMSGNGRSGTIHGPRVTGETLRSPEVSVLICSEGYGMCVVLRRAGECDNAVLCPLIV